MNLLIGGGELYTWGSNENGCLGIGSIDVLHSPERVQGPFSESPVDQVSCGWKHTAAISGKDCFEIEFQCSVIVIYWKTGMVES
ncbi:hypothetical protein CICLE_v10003980mg [Citrus x clementina]|uniref:Uncharacterized protein n=1 Tax=Citrus clementina TaxID=85681 RepID=V4SWT8_CITCL|nr:hypothetical protein CICLE_v10003980mg [Citrus x clementina]